jgi:AraC-like DNA-binding protein
VDVARTPATIRKGDAGVFYLLINYRGAQQFTLNRDVIDLGPCDMVLLHSSLALYSRSDPAVRRQRGATVFVSPDAAPGGERQLRRLVGRQLSSKDSVVSFVAEHLYLLGTSEFEADDAEQLMTVSSSLISMMLARALQAEQALPAQTRSDALLLRIHSYLQANLADPRLSADSVAAAHHISTRTLHRLFQASGVPFTALLRQLRLDRCRQEILDPAQDQIPIRVIARRWGFPDASHFTRAYKAAHGVSPSDERGRTRQ